MSNKRKDLVKEYEGFWLDRTLKVPVDPSKDFSAFLSFKEFVERYESDRRYKSAAGSERYFAIFFYDLLTRRCKIREEDFDILRKNEDKEIHITILDQTITKYPDFVIRSDKSKIYVEVKKNIDLVEKDIFKYILLREGKEENGMDTDAGEKVLEVIWEYDDHSRSKEGNKGHYHTILEFAKQRGWIDHFTYLYVCDSKGSLAEEDYENRIEELARFLKENLRC